MTKEVFKDIIPMILIPFIFVIIFMPFVKKIAKDINAIDKPRKLHIHKNPIPKLGGLAIFFGFLLGYMIFGEYSSKMNAILIGSFVIIITGIVDDIAGLKPIPKLAGQVIAASIVSIYGGILLQNISAFGIYIDFNIFAYPITIIFIVACINCINLIDGLDGLSGGISSIYFLTIGILSVMMNAYGLEYVLTFIMLGSTLGFLVYNFNPASIFAGDTGSMFMGYMISVISLLGFKNVMMSSLIIPLLILAIPILDTSFAIIRRLLKKQKISSRDTSHIHHQFLNKNLSQKTTVLIIYGINILFSIASIVYVIGDSNLGYIIYGILLLLVVIFILKTNVVFDYEEIKQRILCKIKKQK